MKISVIGLGYIGLPTAAIFASKGFEVIGVDLNPNVVKTVNRGEIHFIEPSLDKIVKTAVDAGCLKASTVLKPAEAFIIAVPTPFKTISHYTTWNVTEHHRKILRAHIGKCSAIFYLFYGKFMENIWQKAP